MEHILCGAGGDEVIDLLARAFVEPGQMVIDLPPTFGMYKWEADVLGAGYMSVPRRPDFSVDIDAVESTVRALRGVGRAAQAAVRDQPEQPRRLDHAARRTCCGCSTCRSWSWSTRPTSTSATQQSLAPLVPERDNLIVLRTFSKLAGMAGLRVGYGVFPLPVIRHLWKVKQPYTPNVAGSIMAIAAMQDREWLDRSVLALTSERLRLARRAARASSG